MMKTKTNRQRIYATLLMLGAVILLYRTITLVSQGALDFFVLWVSVMLIVEMLIDFSCLLAALRWWITKNSAKARLALRLGAAAAIFHALRVLVFVIGRTGPWVDFDVKPEYRALHGQRWTWGEVYFASIMSILGIIGVIVIWNLIVNARKKRLHEKS